MCDKVIHSELFEPSVKQYKQQRCQPTAVGFKILYLLTLKYKILKIDQPANFPQNFEYFCYLKLLKVHYAERYGARNGIF